MHLRGLTLESCWLAKARSLMSKRTPRAVAVVGLSTTHISEFGEDRKRILEKLWRDFLADPSQWWDHRFEKGNVRYPDFKHKITQESLWINGKLNPPWVKAKVAALHPGSVPLNSFSFNTRLARYVQAGQYEKTVEFFQHIQQKGMTLDSFTFVPVLKACAALQALNDGRHIHKLIMQCGCDSDIHVGSSLIDMYAKCGSMEDAWKVFSKLPKRDVVVWNAMILGYVKCGQAQKALGLSKLMKEDLVEPACVTFVGLVNACAKLKALDWGRHIHKQIRQLHFHLDVYVGSSLIDMYSKCGSIEDAWRVFCELPRKDVVSWNAMLQGYVRCGHGWKALQMFRQMQQQRVELDSVTFVGVLNACANEATLQEGKDLHMEAVRLGFESDSVVGTSIVNMYIKCGNIEDALKVFKSMPVCNMVSLNVIIQGYLKSGQGLKALELCRYMQQKQVEPTPVNCVQLLKACASAMALKEGQEIHEQLIQRGYDSNIFVGNSLINMYMKSGSLEEAWRVFNHMPQHNVVSWNVMILGHVKCGQSQRALDLFQKMQEEGMDPDSVTFLGLINACTNLRALDEGRHLHTQIIRSGFESDIFVGSSLITMYAECGRIEDSQKIFKRIPTKDVVTWNALILGLVKCGQASKALELFRLMQLEGVQLNTVTFVGVLNACSTARALEEGKSVHELIVERGYESDVFVGSSLISMYSKCGSVDEAQIVFNRMPTHNVVSWTALLGGYAMHGNAREALRHFEQMCKVGIEMNGFIFTSLLSACSHAGLVDEGFHFYVSMSGVWSISKMVEHKGCLIDLLGRAGRLHEAEDLIMSISCEPNTTVWLSLLSACRVHGNVEMGERLAQIVLQLDPENAACYTLLSNICATSNTCNRSAIVTREKCNCD